jgi:N-acyl homoserine lactone hydrolase
VIDFAMEEPISGVHKNMRTFKKLLWLAGIPILTLVALAIYLLRGGFCRFEVTPYPLHPTAFANWRDVFAHPSGISLRTFLTGTVHMDACLNLDPESPRQADCDHVPRDLAVLVHWVHHPQFGDFLIDAGFDDSFAKHSPYGDYTEAMKLFNWFYGITNRQESGTDLGTQLGRANVRPKAVFFTHLHPDHTAGVSALGAQTLLVFGKAEAGFLARVAVANYLSGKPKLSSLDFSDARVLLPLGPSVDVFGDGSFWAISVPGHTDDGIAYLVNGTTPVFLTGDASHFAWAFDADIGPRGWNDTGTARGRVSLAAMRTFAKAYPKVKLIYGHEAGDP